MDRISAMAGHKEFLKLLREARTVEERVALLFLEAGLCVRIGTLVEAETPWESERFREEKDVIVTERHIIEVKSATAASKVFTSVEDFPYPCAYACTVKRWEERKQKPLAFVLVSLATDAVLVIPARTHGQWSVVTSHDRRRGGHPSPTYCAPKELLRPFQSLVDFLVQDDDA